ncbi:MAG: hypothetical protein ACRD1T_22810, partial [Acidimicrobiia bacterium]
MIAYYFLVSLLPLMLHPFWNMFVGDLTMIKYLGFICFALALLKLLERGTSPGFLETPQARWFLVFFIIMTISYTSKGLTFSWDHSPLISYFSQVMFFVTTLTLIDSSDRLRWTLLVAIGSLGWATLYVIREFQKLGNR